MQRMIPTPRRPLAMLLIWCALPAALVLLASEAKAQASVIGTWQGTLLPDSQNLRLIYEIEQTASSGLSGTMSVPAQGAQGIALRDVGFEDGILTMTFAVPGGGSFEGELSKDGTTIDGVFRQAGAEIPLSLQRAAADAAMAAPTRPQEPRGEVPYLAEEVTIDVEDRQLAGTLTRPPKAQFTGVGVVLVAGAGPQDRDGTQRGHRPLLVLADQLTRRGIATIRFDEQGMGASTGEAGMITPSSQALDVRQAVARLAEANGMQMIGVVAHSEGALSALQAMAAEPEIAFAVTLGAPALPGLEALRLRAEAAKRGQLTMAGMQARVVHAMAATMPNETVDVSQLVAAAQAELAELPEGPRAQLEKVFTAETLGQIAAQLQQPWNRASLASAPAQILRAINRPILAIYGSRDQVLDISAHLDAMRAARQDLPGEVAVLDGLNHFFQETGSADRAVGQIEQTLAPVVWEKLVAFVESDIVAQQP